jgi:hypothetical protein
MQREQDEAKAKTKGGLTPIRVARGVYDFRNFEEV